MKKYLIDAATDTIINVVLVDPDNLPDAGAGFRLDDTGGNIGDVWNGSEWAAPAGVALAAERAKMKCTRQQGKLALGATVWANVVALADDATTPWGLKVAVADTVEWDRMDEDMAALIWAMQLTDAQADDLFRLAMTL